MLQFQIIFLCLLALGRSAVIQDDKTGLDEDDVKAALKAIGERLDRWDAFYMGRLEPRMIGAATSLANLDTNIRNLQERAHVWDTFQLHVAAWNDQIKSLHSKINIMNEGVEKALSPDSRLTSTLHSLDGNLKSLENKLELQWKQSSEAMAPMISDFALKKLLLLVQKLDRKLDRGANLLNNAEVFEKPSCNVQAGFGDLLREVSNKVDVIFGEDEQPSRACRRLSEDLRKLVEEQQPNAAIRHASHRRRDVGELLRDVEQGYKKLLKHQEKNFEENEDILRDIEKRLDDIEDDDDLEELIVKKFKQVERQLKGIRAEVDDDDDDDDDSDDDDTREKKSGKKHDDSDDDDSDDDDDDTKERRHRKKHDDSDDDDSDDDDDDTKERRHRKKHDDSDDDDSDDDDDTKERRHRKKHDDSDDDDSDDDDDDTKERRHRKKHDDSNDDDSDDDDTRERRHRKKHDDSDDDDSDDDDDTRERRHRKKNDDDSDDDDTRERRSEQKHDDTDEDDDDDSKQKQSNDTDEDDDRNGTRHK